MRALCAGACALSALVCLALAPASAAAWTSPPPSSSPPSEAEVWRPFRVNLTSAQAYGNPYTEVTLNVTLFPPQSGAISETAAMWGKVKRLSNNKGRASTNREREKGSDAGRDGDTEHRCGSAKATRE